MPRRFTPAEYVTVSIKSPRLAGINDGRSRACIVGTCTMSWAEIARRVPRVNIEATTLNMNPLCVFFLRSTSAAWYTDACHAFHSRVPRIEYTNYARRKIRGPVPFVSARVPAGLRCRRVLENRCAHYETGLGIFMHLRCVRFKPRIQVP